jgi:hypothetical protein
VPQFTASRINRTAWIKLQWDTIRMESRLQDLQKKLKAFYVAGDSPEDHVQLRMKMKLLKSHIIRMRIAYEIGGFSIGGWGGVWNQDELGYAVPVNGVGFEALAGYRNLFPEHDSNFPNVSILTAFMNAGVPTSWIDVNANSYDLLKIAQLLGIINEIKLAHRPTRTC